MLKVKRGRCDYYYSYNPLGASFFETEGHIRKRIKDKIVAGDNEKNVSRNDVKIQKEVHTEGIIRRQSGIFCIVQVSTIQIQKKRKNSPN